MKHLIVVITLLGIYACSSPSCEDEEFDLIGSWQLVEFCFSPGDSSCPIQTPTQEQIVEFRADSTFTFAIGDISTVGTFSVNNRLIEFIDALGETNQQRFILESSSACRLDLGPPCFEECREHYVRL